jgi:hypothetical protein
MLPQEKRKMKRSPVAWIPIAILVVGIIAGVFVIGRNGPIKLKK